MVPDAFAVRTFGVESDVQLEVWYGADCESHRWVGRTASSRSTGARHRDRFKFKEYTGEALLFAVRQALHHYMDERIWKRIQLKRHGEGFSWKTPAAEYAKLYEAARAARGISSATQSSGKAAPGSGPPGRGTGQNQQASEKGVRNQKPVGTSN